MMFSKFGEITKEAKFSERVREIPEDRNFSMRALGGSV